MNWTLRVGSDALEFGRHDMPVSLITAPEIEYGDIRGESYAVPNGDGVVPGVFDLSGMTLTFDLALRADDEQAVRAIESRMRNLWRSKALRSEAGTVASLTSPSGAVTYGRPRPDKFSADREWASDGRIDLLTVFEAVSDLWFSAEEFSTSLQITQPAYGGVVAPVVAPVITSGSSVRTSSFTVGGELDTYPIIEVQGPVINPAVEVIDVFRFEYRGTLAYDEVLRIDTRPHARTVTVNGAGVALSPTSDRIASASLPPGVHAMTLFGTSQSGTATATVRWRDAFSVY